MSRVSLPQWGGLWAMPSPELFLKFLDQNGAFWTLLLKHDAYATYIARYMLESGVCLSVCLSQGSVWSVHHAINREMSGHCAI